jgi:hypothetical protein
MALGVVGLLDPLGGQAISRRWLLQDGNFVLFAEIHEVVDCVGRYRFVPLFEEGQGFGDRGTYAELRMRIPQGGVARVEPQVIELHVRADQFGQGQSRNEYTGIGLRSACRNQNRLHGANPSRTQV